MYCFFPNNLEFSRVTHRNITRQTSHPSTGLKPEVMIGAPGEWHMGGRKHSDRGWIYPNSPRNRRSNAVPRSNFLLPLGWPHMHVTQQKSHSRCLNARMSIRCEMKQDHHGSLAQEEQEAVLETHVLGKINWLTRFGCNFYHEILIGEYKTLK